MITSTLVILNSLYSRKPDPLKFKIEMDLSDVEDSSQKLIGILPSFQRDLSSFLDQLSVLSRDIRSGAIKAREAVPFIQDFRDTWREVLPPAVLSRITSLNRTLSRTTKGTAAASQRISAFAGSLKDFRNNVVSSLKAYEQLGKVVDKQSAETLKNQKEINEEIRKYRLRMRKLADKDLADAAKAHKEIDDEIRKVRLNVQKLGKKDMKDLIDTVDDVGKKGFDRFNKWDLIMSKLLIRFGVFGIIKSTLFELSRGIGAVTKGIFNLSKESAKLADTSTAFKVLASQVTSADLALSQVRKAAGGVVEEFELMQASTQAAIAGLPVERIDDLMRGARALGPLIGREVPESFERLTNAIVKQERRLLDELGIVIRANDAYKEYAITVGKTANTLTAAEKQTAFMDAVLAAVNEKVTRLGGNLDQAQLPFLRFESAVKDFRMVFGGWLSDTLKVPETLSGLTSAIDEVTEGLMTLPRSAAEASSDFLEAFEGYKKFSDAYTGSIPKMIKEAQELSEEIESGTLSIVEQAKAEKRLDDITVTLSRTFPTLAGILEKDLVAGLRLAAQEAKKLRGQFNGLLQVGAPKLTEAIDENEKAFMASSETIGSLENRIFAASRIINLLTENTDEANASLIRMIETDTRVSQLIYFLAGDMSQLSASTIASRLSSERLTEAKMELNQELSREQLNNKQIILQTKSLIDATVSSGIATKEQWESLSAENNVVEEALKIQTQHIDKTKEVQTALEGATSDYNELSKSIKTLRDLPPDLFRSLAPDDRTQKEIESLTKGYENLQEGLIPILKLKVPQNLDAETESRRILNEILTEYNQLVQDGLLQEETMTGATAKALEEKASKYGISMDMLKPLGDLQLKIEQKRVEAIDQSVDAMIKSTMLEADRIKSTVDDNIEAAKQIEQAWDTTLNNITSLYNHNAEQRIRVQETLAKAQNDVLKAERNQALKDTEEHFEARLKRAQEYYDKVKDEAEETTEASIRASERGVINHLTNLKAIVEASGLTNEAILKIQGDIDGRIKTILENRRKRYVSSEEAIADFVLTTQKDVLKLQSANDKDAVEKAALTYQIRIDNLTKSERESSEVIAAEASFRQAVIDRELAIESESYQSYQDKISKLTKVSTGARLKEELDQLDIHSEYKEKLQQHYNAKMQGLLDKEVKQIEDKTKVVAKTELQERVERIRLAGEKRQEDLENLKKYADQVGLTVEDINVAIALNAAITQQEISDTIDAYKDKMLDSLEGLSKNLPRLLRDIRVNAQKIADGWIPPSARDKTKKTSKLLKETFRGIESMMESAGGRADDLGEAIEIGISTGSNIAAAVASGNIGAIIKSIGEAVPQVVTMIDSLHGISEAKVRRFNERLKKQHEEFAKVASSIGASIGENITKFMEVDFDVLIGQFMQAQLAAKMSEVVIDSFGPSLKDIEKSISAQVGKGEEFVEDLTQTTMGVTALIQEERASVKALDTHITNLIFEREEEILAAHREGKTVQEIANEILRNKFGLAMISESIGNLTGIWETDLEPKFKDIATTLRSVFDYTEDAKDEVKEASLRTFRAITEPQANQLIILMGRQVDHLATIASNTTTMVQRFPAVNMGIVDGIGVTAAPSDLPPAVSDMARDEGVEDTLNININVNGELKDTTATGIEDGFLVNNVVPIVAEEESRMIRRKKSALGFSKTIK